MSELPSQRLAAAAAGPFVILLVAIGLAIQGGHAGASHEPTHNGGMLAMSIDLDVTGNTATSLGPREDCTQVSPGDTVTFDVTAEGIAAAYAMIAFHALLSLPVAASHQTHDINFLLSSTPGSMTLDPSGESSDPNTWFLEGYDYSDWAIVPAESGSGVLARVTIQISPDAAPAAWPLMILEPVHIDTQNNALLANATNNANLVIGGTCEDPPPTPAATVPYPPTPPTPGTSPVLTPTSVATPWPPPTNGGMESMSIDLDVSGNAAATLGPRDNCIQVNPGDTVTLDVTAEGIPASNRIIAFSFELGYDAPGVRIDNASANYLLGTRPQSSVLDVSEPLPDSDGVWIASVADIADTATTSEEGSGVLVRATLSTSASITPGLHPLTLAHAAHITPLGEALVPAALNPAFLAVGVPCENLPTPPPTPAVTTHPTPVYTQPPPGPTLTPTPTATPGPGAIPVGIDHNGGTPDINSGPLLVSVGQTFNMRLVVEPPPGLVGAWEAEFHYEPSAMTVVSCIPHAESVCNTAFANNTVKVAGVALSGLPGASSLAEITFTWSAAAPVCVAVGPSIQTLADTTGSPLFSYVSIGLVCEEGAATPDAQQPTPMPSALPTPPPTYPPFPSPTPGGTAGPTSTPDGGPPVSEPTAAAQAPTSAPTPTPTPAPSTPSPSPTSSAKPTPTALGAVALPQTGGTAVGTSAALPVAVIGMAGLLAGSAAWLSLRRRPEHR